MPKGKVYESKWDVSPTRDLSHSLLLHPHKRKDRADCFTPQRLFLITVRWAISEQTQTWQETRLSPGLFISPPFVMPRRGPSNYFVPGLFIWGFQSINNPATLTPQDNRVKRVDPKSCLFSPLATLALVHEPKSASKNLGENVLQNKYMGGEESGWRLRGDLGLGVGTPLWLYSNAFYLCLEEGLWISGKGKRLN